VRIGVAAAKGFAWGKELPCYGVSTLEAMALGLGVWEGTIVCAMDARRSQVYNAIFEAKNGQISRICPDRAISLAELGQELSTVSGPIYLVGDGAALCHKTLTGLSLILPPEWKQHQRAVGVGLAALNTIARGETGDGGSLTPNYLRLSQAERECLEKDQQK
jgi:tRNA threonylcarbamoyladenosine biosynthesis protein TsaB